jgi:hypothetical protein
MTDEVPRPRLIGTRIQIDLCAGIAPTVARAQDSARRVTSQRLSKLSQSWLRAHAPAIDLIAKIRDVLPRSTAILALEHREISRRVTRERSRSNDGTILQFSKPRVGDRFAPAGLVDGAFGPPLHTSATTTRPKARAATNKVENMATRSSTTNC